MLLRTLQQKIAFLLAICLQTFLCVCILPVKLRNIRYVLNVCSLFNKGGHANLVFSQQSRIRKFLGSCGYRKSTNFLCLPVRKSQFRKILRCSSTEITNQYTFFTIEQEDGTPLLKSSSSFSVFLW
jgi:hypothetical protein